MSAAVQSVRRQIVVTYHKEAVSKAPICLLICPQLEQERSMSVLCILLLHHMMMAQGSEA